ncbi:hypothetical protein OsJ_31823 [Oryza sativa Japonica Group]|uniref:60S ribosomal protein L21 n=1 Tax=Oryza sativa subsp. japonica TaxID=39947 RepID=A3C5J8_ORYSJ|nr:hypothetical protein OsJ_31823 [Oryza sativa Japonica Group]
MPAGHGLRARTRDLFARPFRKKGYIPLTTYLRTYKIGEHVDVKVNGAVHKGMPHKFYHGRTGRVWNVTKRAIGVEINKQYNPRSPNTPAAAPPLCHRSVVGNRIIRKRIHVRVEHVQPSRCTEEFRLRNIKNDQLKADAKARGEVISTKRQPQGPKPGFMVEGATLETVTPIPYDVFGAGKFSYFLQEMNYFTPFVAVILFPTSCKK